MSNEAKIVCLSVSSVVSVASCLRKWTYLGPESFGQLASLWVVRVSVQLGTARRAWTHFETGVLRGCRGVGREFLGFRSYCAKFPPVFCAVRGAAASRFRAGGAESFVSWSVSIELSKTLPPGFGQ